MKITVAGIAAVEDLVLRADDEDVVELAEEGGGALQGQHERRDGDHHGGQEAHRRGRARNLRKGRDDVVLRFCVIGKVRFVAALVSSFDHGWGSKAQVRMVRLGQVEPAAGR